MKQQKKKSTSEAGSPAPVQRSEEKRFSVLSVVLVAVLPALFLVALFVQNAPLRWIYLVLTALAVVVMWLMRAFLPSARSLLTVTHIALAVVISVALIMSGQPSARPLTQASQPGSQNRTGQNNPGAGLSSLTNNDNSPSPEPEGKNEPENKVLSLAEQRLISFADLWKAGDIPGMLEYCQPSWIARQSTPESTLWQMFSNKYPYDFVIEKATGSDSNVSRIISAKAYYNEQTGITVRRLQIMMYKVNDQWYVDPNTLRGTLVDEAAEAASQNSDLTVHSTVTPTSTPVPEGSGVNVYYNPDGGKYYHAIPNCSAVSEQYWPLTKLQYELLNSQEFKNLLPCTKCNPPKRPSLVP